MPASGEYELTAADLAVVKGALRDVGPANVPRLREIHERFLRELRPKLTATQRAVAMREASLVELARIEHAPRCTDLTKNGRGWLQCQLPEGHDADPLSLHLIDPFGPVVPENRDAR